MFFRDGDGRLTALACLTLVACGPANPFANRNAEFSANSSNLSGVCAGSQVVEGIDVSSYQATVNWAEVAASGRGFAFARIADGITLDSDFKTNWAAIDQAGLVRGLYQFFRSEHPGSTQANLILQNVSSFGPGDLPPVLDVEVTDNATPATMASEIQDWVSTITAATGLKPIIYSGSYFWNDDVVATTESNLPLWLPQYGPTCPTPPTAWSTWTFFQYSSTGTVSGVSGQVDLDRYNGSLAELQALANGSAANSCTADSQCNNGQTGTQMVCGNGGTCITGCHANSDCPTGDSCNMTGATYSCITTPGCTSDSQCNGGQAGAQMICGTASMCVSGCHQTSDCPSGDICDAAQATCMAAPAGCTTDSACNNGSTGTQMICVNTQCVAGCHADSDCPDGESCDTADTTCVGCLSDSNCNGGQTGRQSICNSSMICVEGCHQDTDCPTGEMCETTEDTCVAEIVDAGSPVIDAGEPVVDAGNPVLDAGEPVVDAGEPAVDAGEPVVDAGEPADAGNDNPVDAGSTVDAGNDSSVDAGDDSSFDAGSIVDAGECDGGPCS